MRHNRPEILIGCWNAYTDWVSEVMYGIEEEGCLFSSYEMESEKDIRFSLAEVTVTIIDKQASLWAYLADNHQQIDIAVSSAAACRTLGANAARYLKGKKLIDI